MVDVGGQSKEVNYGFGVPEDFDSETYRLFVSQYQPVLRRRSLRWSNVIVKRFCRKGIPNRYRPMAWLHLSQAADRMKQQPGLYQQLIKQKWDPALQETIKTDIHRTFPENTYFSNKDNSRGMQTPLFNVLIALGQQNPTIGYCQGMNFIAGILLLIVKDEEKVFWLMDTLINTILPDFYNPNMKALKIEQEVFGNIVRWKLPEVHAHMEKMQIPWCLIVTKWFICLYADVLPVETVLRIWDCLFYEGSKVLLRVSLALVSINKNKILACKDFSQTVDLFKKTVKSPEVLNCHEFMQYAFREIGSFPRSQIRVFQEQCQVGLA